jgi:hypothetical protein
MPNFNIEFLFNPVQPSAVHSNLIIHLISLACDSLNMCILRVHLLAHCTTELVEALGCSVESVYSHMN